MGRTRTPLRPQLGSFLLAACLSLVARVATAGEFDSYRYELTAGQGHEVCKHMQGVYETNFKRPHDQTAIAAINGVPLPPPQKDSNRLFRLKSSFYPSSPEFEAVPWRIVTLQPPKDRSYGPRAALLANLDIDNDGQMDVVVKLSFYGSRFGMEELLVLEQKALDASAEHIAFEDLRSPRYTGNTAYVRPFIYRGTVFIHSYDYRRATVREIEQGLGETPFAPPEVLTVYKYVKSVPSKRGTEVREVLCKFQMEPK